MRYIAHRLNRPIAALSVEVTLHLDGEPILATGAEMTVQCVMADGSDPASLVAEATATSMVANSLIRGLPVSVTPR